MPIISVIIPCYNVEKMVGRCLCSLEKQTVGFDHVLSKKQFLGFAENIKKIVI